MHQQELRSMCAVMSHRGPHSEGYYQSSYAGLGVRRLGIVDPKGGKQPIHNEDGSVSVVLDGQIYNFRELRQELQGRGHSFSTDTDTEVIAHLYEEYGEQCVERMRGMFSLALWDERGAKLLLARDRLGIKPLFYTEVADRLIFASELKALLQLPEVNRRFNWHAVSRVFAFLCTPRSESIIQGVGKLAPGHILIASPHQGFHVTPYWQLNFEPDYTRSEDYFTERLRWLLQESITLHAQSDVPLGCFLSGGLDSSAVVALMAGLSRNPIKTFSAGFKERDWNELDYARVVARTFGTDHHELILKPDALETIIEALPRYLDEPFGDPSAIPTYMVSKLASEHVTVVLTGDGGDELFAGYEKYPVERRERRYSRLLAPVRPLLGFVSGVMPEGIKGRNFLRHFSLSQWERHLDAVICFKQEQIQRLLQPEILEALPSWDPCRLEREYLATGNRDWLSALLYLDLSGRLSLNDILTKVDRMSMANSLQARPPLLDHKIVEMVATIPPELKLHNGTTKYIFKRAMRGILPDAIVNRPKRGFGVPLGPWFRGPLRNLVREILLSDTTRRRGIFNTEYLEQLVQWHEKGRPLEMQLWTLISFELWCRAFLDR